MTPLQFLSIFRAHYKIALATFFVILLLGIGITLIMPNRYETSTSLVFDLESPDPVAGVMLPIGLATQVDIIKSDRLAQQVVRNLKLDQNPALLKIWQESTEGKGNVQIWIGEFLQKGLQVTTQGASNIITIGYASRDAVFAAAVANAYAQAYIDTSIELRVDPARQYARWFGEQVKVMRDNLEKAQTRLSVYQKQNGIVSKDEQSDTETAKLNELTTQLTVAQGQTVDIRSQVSSGVDATTAIAKSALLQSLRSDIARQESKLREAGENLGKNHPQYQRMEAELASLKNQLEVEKLNVARDISVSKNMAVNKESQLRAAIATQKRKLLELKDGRDQLAVFQRDVDAAQVSYDAMVKRFDQTSLESKVTQTKVSVLSPAIEPFEPASPNISKNMAVTFLLAVLLGCGAAILMESLDRRIRSVQDLEDMLQVPVLAVLSPPKKHNRLAQLTSQTLRLELK